MNFITTPGGADPQSIAVDSAGKFAYVANVECGDGGYVSMYTINPATGALTVIGPPVPTDDEGTDFVTVDPFGKFAYVANSGLFDTDGSVDDVHHRRHDRGLNIHRSDRRKLSGFLLFQFCGRASIRQVRLCGGWGRRFKQRREVHD